VAKVRTQDDTTNPGASPLLANLLSSQPPRIDAAAARALLVDRFGIVAEVREVACERDQNFHAVTAAGTGYVLKIANPEEDRTSIAFQTDALLWLERTDPTLPVSKVVATLDGHHETLITLPDGRTSIVRVLTWLTGTPLVKVGITAQIEKTIGAVLARLDRALRDFHHPGARRHLLWDIRQARHLEPLMETLPKDALGRTVRAEFTRYADHVLPRLGDLRHQAVHNDLNHHNVIVDPHRPTTISGVIDFGDMVDTCLIIDVAVAASYLANQPRDALGSVARMVAAYHAVTPLLPEEIAVLRDLIVARLVTAITITERRARRYPENAAYILRNNGPARLAMERFAALDRATVTAALRRACDLET